MVDAKNVAGIAQLGVVFLLFLIGMELSYERLKAMRRLVFGLGSLQIVLSTTVIGGVAVLAGNTTDVSIILGACLALSSTAIVVEVLSNQGRLATAAGRASFSVLLAQDLAVIPILLFVSILGAGASRSVMTSLVLALLNAALAVGAIVIIGRLFLRPFVPLGRHRRHQRIICGSGVVRDCRYGGRGGPGRTSHGARSLHCGPVAR